MITHHPADDLLIEYASGSLPSAETLVVAAHLSLCGNCRETVAQLEAVAAETLEAGMPAELGEGSLAAVMGRIDAADRAPVSSETIRFDARTRALLPAPVRDLIASDIDALPWRRKTRGIEQAEISSYGGAQVALLRIREGHRVPSHTHSGREYTLVLSGGFSDGQDHYGRGDLAVADGAVDHAPTADPGEPCLCLTVQDGATRLTGPIGRLLDPFLRRSA